MPNLFSELLEADQKQKAQLQEKVTRKVTSNATQPREYAREKSREESHEQPRDLPTRDEIQEFNFRLRDERKGKVQAEVPYEWQEELEQIALELRVKKLELYRYIYGVFLGKVKPKK